MLDFYHCLDINFTCEILKKESFKNLNSSKIIIIINAALTDFFV